jgi:Cft2 family RNA processing exonuclease
MKLRQFLTDDISFEENDINKTTNFIHDVFDKACKLSLKKKKIVKSLSIQMSLFDIQKKLIFLLKFYNDNLNRLVLNQIQTYTKYFEVKTRTLLYKMKLRQFLTDDISFEENDINKTTNFIHDVFDKACKLSLKKKKIVKKRNKKWFPIQGFSKILV